MKKFLTALLLLSFVLTGCGGEKTADNPATKAEQTNEVSPSDNEKFFANGQFKVGTDLPVGEYLAVGTGYVEVATSPEGGNSIVVNDNIVSAQRYVTAQAGEYVKLQGDIKLYPASSAPKIDASNGKIPTGQFKCGTDITAGEYKITLDKDGYFAVTKTTGRDFVKNQFAPEGGSFYATVVDGQFLQIKNGTGEFVGAVQPQTAQPAPQPAKVLNLGMTFGQFRDALNANIATYIPEFGWDVSAMNLMVGNQQDVFLHQFTDRIAILGTTEKSSGLVRGIVVMSLPQNQNDYDGALLAYSLVMATLSPQIGYGERSQLCSELRIFSDLPDTYAELKKQSYSILRGNVKYSSAFNAEKGAFHFFATAKDLPLSTIVPSK
ncbi:MAG: hypothetical protein IJ774_11130 [Selenomonadaceae bacterium]|nr:hypothetical protein [Selenomonadaceae bacterium]